MLSIWDEGRGGLWQCHRRDLEAVWFGHTAVSWQEGGRKDTLHPAAKLGWAKTSITAVPRDFPIPKKTQKRLHRSIHSKERC